MRYHPIDALNPDRSVSFLSDGVLYEHADEHGTVPLRLPDRVPFSRFAVEHSKLFPDIGRLLREGSEHVRAGNVEGADESLSALLRMNEGSQGEPLGLPNAEGYAKTLMTSAMETYLRQTATVDTEMVQELAAKYGIDRLSIDDIRLRPEELDSVPA